MSESMNEIYRQHRTAQDQYVYFILAAAAAGIGLSVQRTTGATLEWSMFILGAAVLSWGASFYCGCVHLNYVKATLYANMALLRVEAGHDEAVGNHPERVSAAATGIRQAIESNVDRGASMASWQFRLLVAGAALFVAWHVVEMAERTCRMPVAPSTTMPASTGNAP